MICERKRLSWSSRRRNGRKEDVVSLFRCCRGTNDGHSIRFFGGDLRKLCPKTKTPRNSAGRRYDHFMYRTDFWLPPEPQKSGNRDKNIVGCFRCLRSNGCHLARKNLEQVPRPPQRQSFRTHPNLCDLEAEQATVLMPSCGWTTANGL